MSLVLVGSEPVGGGDVVTSVLVCSVVWCMFLALPVASPGGYDPAAYDRYDNSYYQ